MKKVYRSPNRKSRFSVMAVCLLLTALLAIGGTLAYLYTTSDPVVNKFNPAEVENNIHEVLNGSKKDVKIKNTGTTDAYIRVKTAVTWQDKDGNIVHVDAPIHGIDYKVNYSGSENWKYGADGYWYFIRSVAPGDFTEILITEAVLTLDGATIPEGYSLHMEVVSQAIQSTPDTVVTEMWSNTANGGITVKTDGNDIKYIDIANVVPRS